MVVAGRTGKDRTMIPLIALAIYGVGVAVCYGIMIFQTENARDRIMIALLWPVIPAAGVWILLAIGFTGLFGGGHHD